MLKGNIDFLVEYQSVLELKSVETFRGIHEAQLLTYMRLAKKTARLSDQLQYELAKARY